MSTRNSRDKEKMGVEFHKALEILSLRSGCTNHHHYEMPRNGKKLGQTINLLEGQQQERLESDKVLEEANALQRKVTEERAKRKREMEAQLSSLSVEELTKHLFEAQEHRVQTYRHYDSGLEQILKSGDVQQYPGLCAETTATFSVLSDSINSVQLTLLEQHNQTALSKLIQQLQQKEKTKLNLTAALHLEKIRLFNHCSENAGDTEHDQTIDLFHQGIKSVRSQLSSNVEEINEILDELRFAIIDCSD